MAPLPLRSLAFAALLCLVAVPGKGFGAEGEVVNGTVTLAPGGGSGGTVGSLPIVVNPGGGGSPIVIATAVNLGGVYVFTPPAGIAASYYLWIVDGEVVGGGAVSAAHPAVGVDKAALEALDCTTVVLAFLKADTTTAVLYDLTPLVH
jgi:hypothetical protein